MVQGKSNLYKALVVGFVILGFIVGCIAGIKIGDLVFFP